MERVATMMSKLQAMLSELTRSQRNLFDAQREWRPASASTNSPTPVRSGRAGGADADFRAPPTSPPGPNRCASGLDLQNTHMEELADVVGDLKQTVLDAIANNGGLALKSEMDGAVKRMVSILNTQVDGKYIYGGTRRDVPPVTVQSLTDLLALPATADAFQNNAVAQSAKIDNAQTIGSASWRACSANRRSTSSASSGAFDAGVNGSDRR